MKRERTKVGQQGNREGLSSGYNREITSELCTISFRRKHCAQIQGIYEYKQDVDITGIHMYDM